MTERPRRFVCDEKITLPTGGLAVYRYTFCALEEGHPAPCRSMDDLKHEHRFTVALETTTYPPVQAEYPTNTEVTLLRCETCRETDAAK